MFYKSGDGRDLSHGLADLCSVKISITNPLGDSLAQHKVISWQLHYEHLIEYK